MPISSFIPDGSNIGKLEFEEKMMKNQITLSHSYHVALVGY